MPPSKQRVPEEAVLDPWIAISVEQEKRETIALQAKIEADKAAAIRKHERRGNFWAGFAVLAAIAIAFAGIVAWIWAASRDDNVRETQQTEQVRIQEEHETEQLRLTQIIEHERVEQVRLCTTLEQPAERQLCIINLGVPSGE